MSSPPPTAAPRRSQRDKRPAKPVTTVTDVPTTSRKRKHVDGTEDDAPGITGDEAQDADSEEGDEEDAGDDPEDEDDEDDADERPKKAKKAKGRPTKKPRKNDLEKDKDPSAATTTRKPRKPRAPKDPNAPAPAAKRAPKARNAVEARFDPEAVAKTTDISMDNPLFNALLNPNAALQSTTEDFLESLNQTAHQALAELLTMILRCCGCNETIDGDEAIDFDGASSKLDDIVEQLKQTTSPAGTYPLTLKAMPFHNPKIKYTFRSHLSEFFNRLITSSALLGSLYSSQLMETITTWLVPMSSSQIRSIRHTATVIALEIERALAEVGKDVEKEAEVTGRMREGEKKRARTKAADNGAAGTRGKDKELGAKMREIKDRQKRLEEFIAEFIDGVFIHRYRDLDPVIRTECITYLSTYFEILPSHFCSSSQYLRYVGWVLSDSSAAVRLAAIKALQIVYENAGAEGNTTGKRKKKGGVVLPALTHFTTRFLSRLLEIARFDVDVGVRVAVMSVLGCVDELGLLSEEDRNRLGTMIYAEEPRIRKGVARFVSGVWEEWIEAKMGEIEIETSSVVPSGRGGKGGRGRGRGRGRGGASTSKGRNQPAHEVDSDKVGIKGLVYLLVRWGRALDRDKKTGGEQDEDEDEDEEEQEEHQDDDAGTRNGTNADTEMTTESGVGGITAALVASPGKKSTDEASRGRTALAVEAIWDEVDIVRNWEAILDMLVLDHSALKENNANLSPRKRGAKGKKGAKSNGRAKKGKDKSHDEGVQEEDSENEDEEDKEEDHETQVDEAWRLNEVEEGILLEVLVASLSITKKEDETSIEAITRQLMKSLPRLFIKYQTDENRIANVLLLPTVMKLEAYLEMREQAAYTSLWSDIAKQFHAHSSPYVLTVAVQTITSHLLINTSLSNINSQQILELEDELATSLRDTVAGRGNTSTTENVEDRDIEISHLSEDETLTLTSIVLRLRILAGSRDLSSWMEESESGTQSSAWDIICAIAERGRLSLPGEGEMVGEALQLLTLHIMWKSRHLTAEATPTPEEIKQRESLISQRDALLEKLIDYAVGTPVHGNGVVESVKRVAFKKLLDLHILFSSLQIVAADGSLLPLASEALALNMDDEVQWRCAGYVQAEVERYAVAIDAEEFDDAQTDQENTDTEGEQTEEDNEEGDGDKPKKSKKRGKKAEAGTQAIASRTQLEQGYVLLDVISTLLRAIRAGAIHVRHGATLLAHYGRLGPSFDSCSKMMVDMLKEEGMVNDNAELVVLVITQAMKESFAIVQSSVRPEESSTVSLAKLLSGCYVIRGSQLVILHRLDTQHIVQVHTNLLTWIAKQIGSHHSSNKKKEMKTDITFFRALIPLFASLQSRDGLKIKAHLDQVLAQANVEPGNTKLWEPLRAYEKRLGTVMGKDKPPGTKGRPGRKKKNAGASAPSTDAEESEGEVEKLVDDGALSDATSSAPAPRPQRPKRAAASRKKPTVEDEDEDEPDHDDPSTPKAPRPRPRPRATYKTKTKSPEKQPTRVSENASPQNTQNTLPHGSPGLENGFVTPKKSLKRPREDDDERESEVVEDAPPVEPPQDLQMTPAADMQIRRKRIRH
ncbi:hypothetical protein D9758_005390 [Tetrapyrgos nigripes]|uniref:SCD domain-containing protein n=1 Tax=Tetrapyrgos nigripes TaxID=182062 RepID=A0A8H5GI31_9AGAR|nr:hypothetical protein D9758_005390 [Tetrapyrgos nigripes]